MTRASLVDWPTLVVVGSSLTVTWAPYRFWVLKFLGQVVLSPVLVSSNVSGCRCADVAALLWCVALVCGRCLAVCVCAGYVCLLLGHLATQTHSPQLLQRPAGENPHFFIKIVSNHKRVKFAPVDSRWAPRVRTTLKTQGICTHEAKGFCMGCSRKSIVLMLYRC